MQKKNIEDNENIAVFFNELRLTGFQLIVGVPCSLVNNLILYASKSSDFTYISATNEGEAVAIAVGARLAGKQSIIICQNSGLGNMVNPLTSLSSTFGIPVLIIMSWRGAHNKNDAPQHQLMGNITVKMLDLLRINVFSFPINKKEIKFTVENVCKQLQLGNSCCLMVEQKIEWKDNLLPITRNLPSKTRNSTMYCNNTTFSSFLRKKILTVIINHFPINTLYIATTGDTVRELYDIKDQNSNFYMVGSLGYASSIGLGISLFYKGQVIIFDGDGALLMHMGNIATVGHYAPPNFCHILLNNKVHGTTGGQKNSSETVDFLGIAKSCNYSVIVDVDQDNLLDILNLINEKEGPYFIHIKTKYISNKVLDRPNITPKENAIRFIQYIKHNQ